jgi:hypothetical protein
MAGEEAPEHGLVVPRDLEVLGADMVTDEKTEFHLPIIAPEHGPGRNQPFSREDLGLSTEILARKRKNPFPDQVGVTPYVGVPYGHDPKAGCCEPFQSHFIETLVAERTVIAAGEHLNDTIGAFDSEVDTANPVISSQVDLPPQHDSDIARQLLDSTFEAGLRRDITLRSVCEQPSHDPDSISPPCR